MPRSRSATTRRPLMRCWEDSMKAEITGLVGAIVALLGLLGVPVTETDVVSIVAGLTAVVAIAVAVWRRLSEWRNGTG